MKERFLVGALCVAIASDVAVAQAPRAAHATVEVRNPPVLRAAQLLASEARSPQVRFEWAQIAGAQAYLLSGEWVTQRSWAKQTRRLRVTQANARSWTGEQVSIDVALPAGSHSWRVVAVFSPDDVGDFDRPAQLSFEVR